MKILIITPGHPGPDRKSLPPSLTGPYLAALATPHADDIRIMDLAVEVFDENAPVPDVALLSSTMAQFHQIATIAKHLKDKGATIILGGPYATLAYDWDPSIQALADSVVIGEGEEALPQALKDFSDGKLQQTYNMPVDSLDGIPFSRLDLLQHHKYYTSTVIFGTRGCVHNCQYCSLSDLYGHKYLKRPVDEVVEEIRFQTTRPNIGWMSRKMIEFWDDNPACDLDWYHELLEKMIPLKKWWLSQMCLNIADNPETLKLMKASGCKGIFVGIESVSEESLRSQNKDAINQVAEYRRQTRELLRHGINVIGAVMYGFDGDTRDSMFNQTPHLAEKMGLTLLQAHMVTPYPHSDYFKTLESENRLISREPKYYNGYTLVHRPKHLDPAELQEGFIETRKRFYSWRSIFKRMTKHRWSKIPEFLAWNLVFRTPNYQSIPGVDVQKWLDHLKTL